MADQLSLRLEADQLPDLPDLRPMLPRPLPDPFDSDEHLFEPWWGGERALVAIGPADSVGNGEVAIRNAAGVDVTAALPELAGLAVRVAARSAILDGELVVVDGAGAR
jgi:bifunctional non-homologous end joining protein LigD